MKAKQARFTGIGMMILGILLLLIALKCQGVLMFIFMFSGLFVFLASQVVLFIYWRCSYCKKILPFNGSIGMEYCPYCSTELE